MTILNGTTAVIDAQFISLAERLAATHRRVQDVTASYCAALTDGLLTDAEKHALALELEVLIVEARQFQSAL